MEIVLATKNVHKIREFKDMFKPLKHIDLISLLNFSQFQDEEETGETFKEVATNKALHAAKQLKKYVIADDSGLVVPALNGLPGIRSRRYAGEDATDSENREKLLREMRGLNDIERAAFFECSLALVDPEGQVIKATTGISEGHILTAERGRNGFGYDSLFVKHDYDKTFAEINEETKNRISHRRKAFEKMLPTLETLGN